MLTKDFDIDREARSVLFVRRLAAAPQRAFDAWTRPEQVAQWWDPTGAPLVDCRIDLRVGGGFTFVNASHPAMPFSGTYTEVAPPWRLAFDALGSHGQIDFARDGAGTLMRASITCDTAEEFERFLRMGIAEGTARTFDTLAAHLAA